MGRKRPRKKKAKSKQMAAVLSSRCRCTGCDRCAPQRGHCARSPGEYVDRQCQDCHMPRAQRRHLGSGLIAADLSPSHGSPSHFFPSDTDNGYSLGPEPR